MIDIKKYDVVILGGGFSGLLSALYLSDAGFDVAVVEKKKSTGGFIRTLEFEGSKFDLGGHRLVFAKEKLLKGILDRIGFSDDLLVKKKNAGIYLFGEELDYPPTLRDISVFPVKQIISIVKELFFTRFKYRNPKNFADWVKLHYGPSIYNLVFKGYTEKVWGIKAKELPTTWLAKRIGYFKFLNLFFGIPCVFSKDTQDKFLYPKNGIGSLAKDLEKAVSEQSDILTDTELTKISCNGGIYDIELVDEKRNKRLVKSDKIVSTIPLAELVNVLSKGVSYDSRKLKYRHIVFLNLVLKKQSSLPKAQWLYIPYKDIMFSRIYNFCNWSTSLCRENTCSLSLEIIGDDSVLDYDMDFVKEKAFEAFDKLGIAIKPEDLVDAFFVKEKYAYPLSVDKEEFGVDKLKQDIVKDYPNLFLAGRMGQHVYMDIEDCVNSVLSTTEKIKTSGKQI